MCTALCLSHACLPARCPTHPPPHLVGHPPNGALRHLGKHHVPHLPAECGARSGDAIPHEQRGGGEVHDAQHGGGGQACGGGAGAPHPMSSAVGARCMVAPPAVGEGQFNELPLSPNGRVHAQSMPPARARANSPEGSMFSASTACLKKNGTCKQGSAHARRPAPAQPGCAAPALPAGPRLLIWAVLQHWAAALGCCTGLLHWGAALGCSEPSLPQRGAPGHSTPWKPPAGPGLPGCVV